MVSITTPEEEGCATDDGRTEKSYLRRNLYQTSSRLDNFFIPQNDSRFMSVLASHLARTRFQQ